MTREEAIEYLIPINEEFKKLGFNRHLTLAIETLASNPQRKTSKELSWQDIRKIVTIADDIADFNTYRNRDTGEEDYYSEVLRKFNEE